MLNRLLGKSYGGEDGTRSQGSRRKHSRRGSGSTAKSLESRDKERNREDRRREDGEHNRTRKETYTEERSGSRDRGDTKRERRTKRDKKDKDRTGDENLDKSAEWYDEGSARGPLGGSSGFSEQVRSSGFAQFPGQYNPSGFVGGPLAPSAGLSDRIPDQFPGQFPLNSTAPYRPPPSANQGGPGLAAEYYGDAGQSIAQQPGVRPQPPPVGAPQTQMAAVPSFFNGGISSDINQASMGNTSIMNNVSSAYQQPNTSGPVATYSHGSDKPDKKHHSLYTPNVATLGAAAAGAAVGYTMSNPSHQLEPGIATNFGESGQSEFTTSSYQRPTNSYQHHESASASVGTSRPSKYSQQQSHLPLYAAAAVGATGMAAAASHNSHNQSSLPYQTSQMAQRHRHRGPLNLLVDFFRDPEGVAKFEEYTEYIGVCKDCFAPGSSPRDAPRKHHYRYRSPKYRRINGSRIDKDNRYWSSDGESQKKNKGSWLTTAIAGYGVAKIGEKLFNQSYSPDDTYTVKSDRAQRPQSSPSGRRSSFSSDKKDPNSRFVTSKFDASRRKGSLERAGTKFVGSGKEFMNDKYSQVYGDSSMVTYGSPKQSRLRSRSRSKSQDRKGGLFGDIIGAAMVTSLLSTKSRRRSRSPRVAFAKSKYKTRGESPDHGPTSDQRNSANDQRSRRSPTNRSDRRASHKKKASFFNFSVESSSTEGIIKSDDSSGRKRAYNAKIKEQSKTDAALAIAGAAILTSNERRPEDKPIRGIELVAVKESKPSQVRKIRSDAKNKGELSLSGLKEIRRASVSEDEYVSGDSSLAYGGGHGASRRGSQESFSSDSSDMSKWGWRWGGMKSRGENGRKKPTTSGGHSQQTAAPLTSILKRSVGSTSEQASASYAQIPSSEVRTAEEVPLQHVLPLSTSDQYQFDVASQSSASFSRQPSTSSRPAAVPVQHRQAQAPSIQHPQPIAPLPTTVYDTQPLYAHSYSDPTVHQVFPEIQHQSQYPSSHKQPEIYGDLYQNTFSDSHTQNQGSNTPSFDRGTSNLRRSNTSPILSTTQPLSDLHGPSAVRLEQAAEQVELDRKQNRRRKGESQISQSTYHCQATGDFDSLVKGDEVPTARASKLPVSEMMHQDRFRNEDVLVPTAVDTKPSEPSTWAASVAIGGMGSSISNVAKNGNPDYTISTQEVHSDQKEHSHPQGTFITEVRQASPEQIEESITRVVDERGSDQEKPVSFWQAAAQISRRNSTHEDYGTFFAPPELQSKTDNQRQATSDNAGDISSSGDPEIITIEPKGFHELSHSPAYSFSYSGDEGDTSPLPWVPKLKIIAPTPILSRNGSIDHGFTPVGNFDEVADNRESPQPTTNSKVTWGEHETIEYIVVTPMDQPDQFIDSAPQIHDDETDITMNRDKARKADDPLPNDATESPHPVSRYGDDVEFAAYLAAGLEKSGFDPSIVIDDPSFRRHESPTRSENSKDQHEFVSPAPNKPRSQSPTQQPPYFPSTGLFNEDLVSVAMPGAFGEETPVIEANEKEKESRDTYFEGNDPHEVHPGKYNDDGIDKSNSFSLEGSVPKFGSNQSLQSITSTSGHMRNTEDASKSEVLPVAKLNGQGQAIIGVPASTGDSVRTDDKSFKNPQNTVTNLTRGVDPAVHSSSPEADYEGEQFHDSQSTEPVDPYEPPLEDLPSSAPTTSRSKGDSSKASRKKSKRKSLGFADVISMESSKGPSLNGEDPVANARSSRGEPVAFESISADKFSEPSEANVNSMEATLDDFDEPKKKHRKSKDRKSTRNDGKVEKIKVDNVVPLNPLDDDESISRVSESVKSRSRRRSAGDSMSKDSGRITQNIPAEVRPLASIGHELPENLLTDLKAEEAGPSANMSIRRTGDIVPVRLEGEPEEKAYRLIPSLDSPQDLPLSPVTPEMLNLGQTGSNDVMPSSSNSLQRISPQEPALSNLEGKVDPQVFSSSRPVSPSPITDSQGFQSLELATKADANSEGLPSSSTAVPLKFRLPPPSPGSARSMSSAPQFSSSRDVAITPPNQKSRPRSTEFKSSAEYRPLWLLETHSPRKEPHVEEAYPSLPSSHSSSRSSSVHDREEYAHELVVKNNDLGPISSALVIDTTTGVLQPDLLDSQQATPTAPPYQTGAGEEAILRQDTDAKFETGESLSSLDRSGPSSLSPFLLSIPQGLERKVSDPQLELCPDQYEALPSLPSSRASSQDAYREPSIEKPRFTPEDHTPSDNGIDPYQLMTPSNGDTKRFESEIETGGIINLDQERNQSPIGPIAPGTHEPPRYLDIFSVGDDENAGDDAEEIGNDSAMMQVLDSSLVTATGSSNEKVKILTVSEQRLIREQDAQDAVDSWSITPKTSKKDKKDKKKRQKGASSGFSKVPEPTSERAIEISNNALSSGDIINVDEANDEAIARDAAISIPGSYLAQPAHNPEASSLYTETAQDEVMTVLAGGAQDTSKDELVESRPSPPALQDSGSTGKKSKKSKSKKSKRAQGKSGLKSQEPQLGDSIMSPRQEITLAQVGPQISPLQGENLETRTSSILQEIPNTRDESPEPPEMISGSPFGVIQNEKSKSEGVDTNLQKQLNESIDLSLASNSDRYISPNDEGEELVSKIEGDRLPLANLNQQQDVKMMYIHNDSLDGDGRAFSDNPLAKLDNKQNHLQFHHGSYKLAADSPETKDIYEVPVDERWAKTDFRPNFETTKLPRDNDLPTPLPDAQDLALQEPLPNADDLDLLEPLPDDDDLDLLESLPDGDDLDLLESLPVDDDLDLLEPLPNDDDLDLLEPLPQSDDLDLLESSPKDDELDVFGTVPEGEHPDLLKPLSHQSDLGLSGPVNPENGLPLLTPLSTMDEAGVPEPLSDNYVQTLPERSLADENSGLEERLSTANKFNILQPFFPNDDLDIQKPLPKGDDLDLLESVLKSDEQRLLETAPAIDELELPAAFRESPENVTYESSPASVLAPSNEPLISRSSSDDVFRLSKTDLVGSLDDSVTEPIMVPASYKKPEISPPWKAGDDHEFLPALPNSPIIEVTTAPSPGENSMAGFSMPEDRHQLSDEPAKSLVPQSTEDLRNEVEDTSLQVTEGNQRPMIIQGSSVDEPVAGNTLLVDSQDTALPTDSNLDLNRAFHNNPEAEALPVNHDADLDKASLINARAPSPERMTHFNQTDVTASPTANTTELPLPGDFIGEPVPSTRFLDDPENVALPLDDDLDPNESLDICPKLELVETSDLQDDALALPGADDSDLPTAIPTNFNIDAPAEQITGNRRQAIAAYTSQQYVKLPASVDAELTTTANFQNQNEGPVLSDIRDLVTTLPESFTAKPSESLSPQNEAQTGELPATDQSVTRAPLLENSKAKPVEIQGSEHEVGARSLPAHTPNESIALPWSPDAEPLNVQAAEYHPEDIGLPTDDDLDLVHESPADLHSRVTFPPRSQDEPNTFLSSPVESLSLPCTLPVSNYHDDPAAVALPPGDDHDLLAVPRKLSVPNYHDDPAAVALPPGDDYDLLAGSPKKESTPDIPQPTSIYADCMSVFQRHSPRRPLEFVQDSGYDENTVDPSHLAEHPDSNSFASEYLQQVAAVAQASELEKLELHPHMPVKSVDVPLPLKSSFEQAASSEKVRSVREQASFEKSEILDKSSPPEQSLFIEERTPFEESKPSPPESFFNRDSAIHVSDSPLLPNRFLIYHPPRDSGYQESDAGAITKLESITTEKNNTFTQYDTIHMDEGHFEKENDPQFVRTPAPESQWDIPAEFKSDHGMSVPATASGFIDVDDEQHSPSDTLPLINPEAAIPSVTEQPHDPSPVDSTTKDRSSVLFQSSPSSRDVHLDQHSIGQGPPHDQTTDDQARPDSWTLPQWSPPDVPTADVQIGSDSAIPPPQNLEKTLGIDPATGFSPVGSPVDADDDLKSPSRSPFTSSNAKQYRLDTITEYSPEESPLQRKHPASLATGSPEPRLRSRRDSLSLALNRGQLAHPPSETAAVEDLISTDDIISRLSWPSVDDESHTVDLDRSRSRNKDRLLTGRTSNTSTPGAGFIKNREHDHRSVSGGSVGSVESITAIIRTPDQARSLSRLSQRSSGTPPLRRTDRSVSGDLRLANKRSSAKPIAKTIGAETDVEVDEGAVSTTTPTAPPVPIPISVVPSSSTYDPVNDKGKSRLIDMTDVYEGWGDVRGGSPMSPTRPPSMRRRQSMQVMELESKVDQLVSENRLLQDAKLKAQTVLNKAEQRNESLTEAIRTRDRYLTQKDSELAELRQILEGLQTQVSRLTEANQELIITKASVEQDHGQKYAELEAQHADTYEQQQQATRELDDLRQQHTQLSAAMEEIVRHEISVAVEGKNLELRKLREELEDAKEQVRILQQQILASRKSDDLIVDRDVDYFDSQCQHLCGRVQQWVLRFSKFSDGRACYLASEIRNEKIVDRFENAMLDGSDVDGYLQDRVKRRDVFMSVVMTMVSEYIFTRYLFGLDREHRSKLKALEKTLAEAGPMKAVHKWRATTLTLLTKRDSFRAQRAQDTEAVALEIYETLATFLPPPAHLVHQIQESLRNVMSSAVDLSIEMRTQRAQYMMLPTLTPEYDTNGDLARKVYFNAALMNERSGTTSSNEGLEAQQAVVRIVLFPLVVKKGDDSGVGDEEIVVCPAQVLTVPGAKDKDIARVQAQLAGQSAVSLGGSDFGMGGMI